MNPRLNLVASLVPPGAALADVGAGDGQLVLDLLVRGVVRRAIAIEARGGAMARLEGRLSGALGAFARWGWGLRPLEPGEADTVCVCGMGEALILEIVRDRAALAASMGRLILGPVKGHRRLRRGLCALGLAPSLEAVAVDRGRPYVVMAVDGRRNGKAGGPIGSLLPGADDPAVDVLIGAELSRAHRVLSARGPDPALLAHIKELEEVAAWRGARR